MRGTSRRAGRFPVLTRARNPNQMAVRVGSCHLSLLFSPLPRPSLSPSLLPLRYVVETLQGKREGEAYQRLGCSHARAGILADPKDHTAPTSP